MGHRCAEERHQLIPVRIHINLVDDPAVAVDRLLGTPVVGIQRQSSRLGIIAEQIEELAKGPEVGKDGRDRAELAGAGGITAEEALRQTVG